MEVKDRIYGLISIPEEFVGIVKSKVFQRLKHVHQLGTMFTFESYVGEYMRSEHCIGTFWQATRMLDALEKNTQWLQELKEDPDRTGEYSMYKLYRKAVQIAALLHDVGHGPFSHVWETVVPDFHHEENAMTCVDDIFASLDPSVLSELRDNNNYGVDLIKSLIVGAPTRFVPGQYRFIFEIVNNKQCKLDVDKWDYIERDYSYMKEMNIDGYDHDTYIDFTDIFLEARVGLNGLHIEYRYKDYHRIYALFKMRAELHTKFYGRVGVLLRDALLLRMARRCEQPIDELKITEITSSNIQHFLELTDDRVLDLLRGDKCFEYLKAGASVKIVDPMDVVKSDNQTVEYVQRDFVPPGKEMPADDLFYFYGDPSDKISVERDLIIRSNFACFLIGA